MMICNNKNEVIKGGWYNQLLAPTGALVLMMVYYISKAAATFSDLEQLCLSILLEVSL